MSVKAVLWDFGDTLCDERWMLAPMEGVEGWPEAYREILEGGGLADPWNTGRITSTDVAETIGEALGVEPARIMDHMRACSRRITFYPGVMALVDTLRIPQAIVTVNPDIFSQVVAPTYDLARRFAPIVTSWEERTVDKADLCDAAIARLPERPARAECLLIDNKAENVEAWRSRGGAGFHFQGEAGLVANWPALTSG
jgi:beta-phosphoglucomutase-like phosphatase (HAD superfamily)